MLQCLSQVTSLMIRASLADVLRSRAFERLLAGSSSSLASSSQPSLAAVGRTITTGAEAPSASTPAADAAAPPAAAAAGTAGPFTFDFFEKTRCISGGVKLSGDLTQSGVRAVQYAP